MKVVVCDISDSKVVFMEDDGERITTRFVVKGTRYKTKIPPIIQTIRSKVFTTGKYNKTEENIIKGELDYADKIIDTLDQMIDQNTHFIVTSLMLHNTNDDHTIMKIVGTLNLIWDYAIQLNPVTMKGFNPVEIQREMQMSAYNRFTLWEKFLKWDAPEIVWCKEIIKTKPRANDGSANIANAYFTIQHYKKLIK